MKQDMVMPQMGESITEGTIIKWLKKVGDTVDKDEIVLEKAGWVARLSCRPTTGHGGSEPSMRENSEYPGNPSPRRLEGMRDYLRIPYRSGRRI